MSHINHIKENKEYLELRFEVLKLIREFLWSRGFKEVETPNLVNVTGQEPYIQPMKVIFHEESGKERHGYLHTSTEYSIKKLLSAGFGDIFTLCKCYRDYEEFGGTHNPEFTMLEWYRVGKDFYFLMDETEELFKYLNDELFNKKMIEDNLSFADKGVSRLHMRDAWREHVGVNLDDYLNLDALITLAKEKGYEIKDGQDYENLFQRIFEKEIEKKLDPEIPTFIHHYPKAMASLSKVSEEDNRYAERFELYYKGLEIANVFTELTDPDEQLKRMREEQSERKAQNKEIYDIDMEFVDALRSGMPVSAGASLGVDRLVLAFSRLKDIDNTLPIPASRLF